MNLIDIIAWLTEDDRDRGPNCRTVIGIDDSGAPILCGHCEEWHTHAHDRVYCGTCGPDVCPRFRGPGIRRSTRLFVALLLTIIITAIILRVLS